MIITIFLHDNNFFLFMKINSLKASLLKLREGGINDRFYSFIH